MRLLLFIFFLFIFGCFNSDSLRGYLDNIPEREEINASLYHYEIIVNDIRREFSNGNYYQVFDLYEKYLTVFYESSIPNDEEILYWVGRSVKEVVGDGLNPSDRGSGETLFNYLKENKQRKNYLGIKFQGNYISNRNKKIYPERLFYQGKHFSLILDQRGDYEWEKRALREIYKIKFTFSDKKNSHNQNLEYSYWLVTRYPDLFPAKDYRSLLNKYVPPEKHDQLSKSRREKLNRIQEILQIHERAQSGNGNFDRICFPTDAPVVVYNRTHWISSRNLTTLALWEPFIVKEGRSQVEGEDGKGWYSVLFRKTRKGFIDKESYEKSCELKWDVDTIIKDFLLGYYQFIVQDYLTAQETIGKLLYNLERISKPDTLDMKLKERGWVFMYKILQEIATRSTSLDNQFTRFAQEYSDYFVISQDRINLEVSDYFLKKTIQYNESSPMLQYFRGFN